ncbi:saccharopine dehydrogenase NADP-binding domain-containing protein [Kribbella sp. NPDC051770]|uniref:saccharopine dehydrogenase family protein n=1 Tax=Kribbella sp. NPDC051770 TaxID=3155413 RepID=UPI00342C6ECA
MKIVVYGATGHTGQFVVAELQRRGLDPVVAGRDAGKLTAMYGNLTSVPAAADDPRALDRALDGAAAVINTAGPFALTAGPLVEAALRAGLPYVDVAAEIEANRDTLTTYADRARRQGTIVLPAMAFYGGLGDLLVTHAMGDWTSADTAEIAYGLSSWQPTPGTRAAGQVSHDRRGGRRVRFTKGALEYHDDPLTQGTWDFPEPLGSQQVVHGFTMADVVTIPSHLAIPEVRTSMAIQAAQDLADPTTPAPTSSDQTFVVDVVVTSNGEQRRTTASGCDIYAVTAPLAVEAVQRILDGRTRTVGATTAGNLFHPADFLQALEPFLIVTTSAQLTPTRR